MSDEPHKCLFCSCKIPQPEVYCFRCGSEVSAARHNAQYGGQFELEWKKMKARIAKATGK